MKYDEKIAEYMLLVASNLVVSVASKNPKKMRDVLMDIERTINSYVDASKAAVLIVELNKLEEEAGNATNN